MHTQIGSKALIKNPALQPLEALLGTWELTGSHPYLPGETLKGRALFAWVEGGAFLSMHAEMDHPDFPHGVALFASDNVVGTLLMLYFDERGISREFTVTAGGNQIIWYRNEPHFSQRNTITIHTNGKELLGEGEMSKDGGPWEKDLALVYRRSM